MYNLLGWTVVSLGLLCSSVQSLAIDRQNPTWLSTRALSNGVALRILPLGDSITWGYKSSDGNGYRQDLKDLLTGNPVTFVGSQRSGNMANSDNEGHPGAMIAEIAQYADLSLPLRPNVILLMAGTNDINSNNATATAPTRLSALLDKLVAAAPDAVIVVATIPPISDSAANSRARTYNSALQTLVNGRRSQGAHMLVADVFSALSTTDLADGLHPTDAGYQKVANVWSQALATASSLGWISAPVTVPGGGNLCLGSLYWDPKYGTIASGVAPGEQIFFADIDGDGREDYLIVGAHGSVDLYQNGGWDGSKWLWYPKGSIASGVGDRANIRFADLDGDGRADYLVVDSSTSAVSMWKNGGPNTSSSGGWVWVSQGTIASGGGLGPGVGVRFADLDGDGRDDFIYLDTSGRVTAYLNGGQGANGWNWLPQGTIATGVGASREDIQFADINGDGKADYLWVHPADGSVDLWRNGGSQGHTDGWNWTSMGQIASGTGSSGRNVRFTDLDGNRRADYAVVAPSNGAVTMWYNGCS